MEPSSSGEGSATREEETNGSSFMTLCLAASNRLLLVDPNERHEVTTSNSLEFLDLDGVEEDFSVTNTDPDDTTLRVAVTAADNNGVVLPTKKTKQVPIRKTVATKGRRYVSGIRSGSKRDDQWNIMFLRLQDYKFENGNCNVPQGYAVDPEIATWVKNQRQAYRYMLEHNTTKRIAPERVTRLNHIGFEWRKYNKTDEEQARLRYNMKRQIPYAPHPPNHRVPVPTNHTPPYVSYTHHSLHRSSPPYSIPPDVIPERIPPTGRLPYNPPPVASPAAPDAATVYLPSPLLPPSPNVAHCSENLGNVSSSGYQDINGTPIDK
jgi:hypothetical protein